MTLNVVAITIHPIKSAAGTPVARADVTRRGLATDRRWMFVDAEGRFVTQRTHPRLALVKPRIEGDAIIVDAPSMQSLRVPLQVEGDRRDVVVWKSTCAAISGGREAAGWTSEYLGMTADLVYMPDSTERAVNPDFGAPGDITSFADGYPILIATTASLDDLNSRLETPLPMNRFRPNVVVGGARAWEEDEWKRIVVGAIPMRVVKGCDRCVVTTVDQATGEKGVEPLKTMATFRHRDGKVWFAVNAIPDAIGTLRVGDPVTP